VNFFLSFDKSDYEPILRQIRREGRFDPIGDLVLSDYENIQPDPKTDYVNRREQRASSDAYRKAARDRYWRTRQVRKYRSRYAKDGRTGRC
jgi:hypothetical protein